MKNIFNTALAATTISVLVFSCKPNVDVPAPSKGSIDLTKYVAIGNSVTAGYADNALYYDGQVSSYPNLIARQFKLAGGGDFRQPLVNAESVGLGASLNAKLALAPVTDCQGIQSLAPAYVSQTGDFGILTRTTGDAPPYNNMGVPGTKVTTMLYAGYGDPNNGQGNYNPFFTRMAVDPASSSILSDAASQNPSFFTASLGNDDVLAYAMAGAAGDAITPSAGAPGMGFDASVDAITDALTANGAKGAIANIPSINAIPYFTTIPYNGLQLDNANATALTAAYSPFGIVFHEGYNGFIIEDPAGPGGLRQLVEGEMVLLSIPQDSIKCAGWGSQKPIPNRFVLTASEIAEINDATSAFNAKLQEAADARGLAFVDVNAFMNTVKSGITYNGISLHSQFVAGGAFSLDGIHLTPIGNALLANHFIKAINAKYKSTIPQLDATKFRGVIFP